MVRWPKSHAHCAAVRCPVSERWCCALRINMELFRASDVMSTGTPETIHSQENVAKLAKMLLRTEHGGFPVVKYDEETRTEVAYGLITRSTRLE